MSAKQKMTECKTAMLLHTPFFASLLLDMMKIKVGKFPELFGPLGVPPTMATDGKTIFVDEDFIQSLKLSEAVFVMCHEVGHAMWLHMPRGKNYLDVGFDGKEFIPMLWNVAGDFVINDMLIESQIGRMPKMGLHDKRFPYTMLIDDVYRKLYDEAPKCPSCGGSGKKQEGQGQQQQQQQGGQGDGEEGNSQHQHGKGSGGNGRGQPCPDCKGTGRQGGQGNTLDVHILDTAKESEAEWKRAVKSAADAAKAQGKLPAALGRFVEDLLAPKVPWAEKLRHSLTKVAGRDTTNWRRPHRRRLVTQGVVMPTYNGFGSGHIVFVVDTSGSMGDNELRQALGECDSILTDCNPSRVTLIGCDAAVDSIYELQMGDTLAGNPPELKGGGGTSFKPPFEYLEQEGIVPATLVYFTDLYGDFPSEPEYPVIWCASADRVQVPFGEVIKVEVGK